MPPSKLPPAELDVLMCLVEHGKLSAVAIREKLETRRPMSHSSVSTLLERLLQKGLVRRAKGDQGKAFIYSAGIAAKRTPTRLVSEFLDRLFGGRNVDLVATLLESRPPTPQELVQLQELLDRLRAEQVPTKRRDPRSKPI